MKLIASISLAVSLLAGSLSAQNVVSGSGCSGFSIGFVGAPQIGSSYDLTCSGGPANGAAAIFLGAVAASPVDLGIIGATSCTLYIDPAALATIAVTLDGTGAFSATVNVANNPGDVGIVIGEQFAAISIGANPLGVITTDLLTTTIQS